MPGDRQARGGQKSEGYIPKPGRREANTEGAETTEALSTTRERGVHPRHHGVPYKHP